MLIEGLGFVDLVLADSDGTASGAAVMFLPLARALKHAPLRAARRLVAGAPLPRIWDF
jgi:hypothetical protein